MSKTRAVAVQRGQLCLPESVANHMYPVQRLLNTRATVLMEGRSPLAHCLLGDATAAEMVTWGITPPFTSCLERILMDIRELCLPDRLIDRSTDRPTSATVWIGEVPLCSVPRFTCLFTLCWLCSFREHQRPGCYMPRKRSVVECSGLQMVSYFSIAIGVRFPRATALG